jgi:signal transduction histidine kinase
MFLEGQINWIWVLGAAAVVGWTVGLVALWFAVRKGTQHVSATDQLDQIQRIAEDSQKRLVETLNAIPVALVETDRQGKFVFANRAAHQLLGRRDAELIGLRFHSATWGITFPDGRPVPPDLLPSARALRGQTVKGFQHLLANPATRRKIMVAVTAMPIENDMGQITGSTAALVEVEALHFPETPFVELQAPPQGATATNADLETLRAELDESRRRADEAVAAAERARHDAEAARAVARKATEDAEAELEGGRRMESVGRLTGGLAHDFNALLGVMTGALDLMLRQADDPARVRRLGQAALAAGQRGESLTRRLTAFAQGDDSPALQVMDVGVLLRGMETRLRALAGPGVDLMIEGPADAAPARLDPVVFEGAVKALTQNAVDAVGEGGSVAVRLEILMEGGLRLSVRDSGPGMDRELAARAIEPFFTTRDGAAGLGLSQAYAFARQSGGTLSIDSAPGEGAEVSVTFPTAA